MENLLVIAVGFILAFAVVLNRRLFIMRILIDPDTQEIAGYIRRAVMSFIMKQYGTSFKIIGAIFVLLLYLASKEFVTWYVPFAVLSGATFSALSAFVGMYYATFANAATAVSTKDGLRQAVYTSLSGGAIMGFSVCGFVLLDLFIWYLIIYTTNAHLTDTEISTILTTTIITFSFGGSFMAFMARVAGGIFTKAEDFAADLVGKGRYSMAEDDKRNPATIGDNAGDIASDCGGMGQDLYESYVAGNAAAMEAGVHSYETSAVYYGLGILASQMLMIPLAISAIGVLASIVGLWSIKVDGHGFRQLLKSFRRAVYITSAIVAVGSGILIYRIMGDLNLWYCVLIGLAAGNTIAYIAEYYTSTCFNPVKRLADKARGGDANVIVEGLAIGSESATYTGVALVVYMMLAYYFGDVYGISIAAVAMLSTLPITLSIDAFGAIADNAQGLLEMTGIHGERAKIGNDLDALGNTTAATGKGYAIGSAAFAAIALLAALWHLTVIVTGTLGVDASQINLEITNSFVVTGIILGVSIPWIFSAKLLRAVGNTAYVIMEEVERQIIELGILEGKSLPDYEKCVSIAVAAAQKYSIVPAILVSIIPLTVAVIGGPAMLMAFLLGAVASAFSKGVYMANAGGAWDNAKKLIEAGLHGGKGSMPHKASVTGDCVGDPYKDTVAPSLNILTKLMVTISILFLPVTLWLHYLIF